MKQLFRIALISVLFLNGCIPLDVVDFGAYDFNDGLGDVHRTGVDLLIQCLRLKFPTDKEGLMLRVGLEFFAFTVRFLTPA